MKLDERALLVSLQISLPTLTRRDKQATEVVEAKYSGKDMGLFNKELINRKFMAPIKAIESQARAYLYKMTCAWGDDGSRLLAVARHMEFSESMNAYGTQFDAEAVKLQAAWGGILSEASARLGELYDVSQYPSASSILDRCRLRVNYAPVPVAGDLRVALDAEQLEELQARITESSLAAVGNTTQEAWARLYEQVEHMAGILSNPKGRVYESLVNNLSDLCDLLPDLNFADDTRLNKAVAVVKQNLLIPVGTLRDAPEVKQNTATAARKIADAMSGWMKK